MPSHPRSPKATPAVRVKLEKGSDAGKDKSSNVPGLPALVQGGNGGNGKTGTGVSRGLDDPGFDAMFEPVVPKEPPRPYTVGTRPPMPPDDGKPPGFYFINVRPKEHPDGTIYGLYNHDMIAGDRLMRDSDTFPLIASDVPVQSWMADWVWYRVESNAIKAAAKLQKYLDKFEAYRSKNKR